MSARSRPLWALLCGLCCLIGAVIACEAQARNMTINGTPMYICPSSTPRPTDVLPPPDPPTFPSTFLANVDYSYVDPARSVVNVQYEAQSVGWIQVSYSGTYSTGLPWLGSGGGINVAYAGFGVTGFSSAYPVTIPPDISNAQITIDSSLGGTYAFAIARASTVISSVPISPPCCLPAPIYPTPRPTYTPYPTPTLFAMTQDYFLDDPVYNYAPPVQLRLRLKSPIRWGAIFFLNWTAASWTLEITNVGTVEYDFLGAGYLYVSEVKQPDGTLNTGVWSPAHNAAQFLGVVEQAYGPHAIQPGQTLTVTVAAWIPPLSQVTKVSLNLNPYQDGDPGWATFTPGQGQAMTWVNQKNTICVGDIRYP